MGNALWCYWLTSNGAGIALLLSAALPIAVTSAPQCTVLQQCTFAGSALFNRQCCSSVILHDHSCDIKSVSGCTFSCSPVGERFAGLLPCGIPRAMRGIDRRFATWLWPCLWLSSPTTALAHPAQNFGSALDDFGHVHSVTVLAWLATVMGRSLTCWSSSRMAVRGAFVVYVLMIVCSAQLSNAQSVASCVIKDAVLESCACNSETRSLPWFNNLGLRDIAARVFVNCSSVGEPNSNALSSRLYEMTGSSLTHFTNLLTSSGNCIPIC